MLASAAQENAPIPDDALVLTVVGTSDTHGRLAQLPLFASYIKALRSTHGPGGIVLVDSGDAFQGTLESDSDEGSTVIAALNAIGYDAMAIGNHEFDYGPQGPQTTIRQSGGDPRGALKQRAKEAQFPLLAANIGCKTDERCLGFPSDTLVTKAQDVRVGIIGLSTDSTLSTTISANVTDLSVRPLARVITERAKSLRERGATVVIVAAHAGGECKSFVSKKALATCDDKGEIFEVARALEPGLVDAIVAGHTHQAIAHTLNGIAIIQSYSGLKAFGRIDLALDKKTKKVISAIVHPPESLRENAIYEGVTVMPDAAVKALTEPAMARAATKKKELLGPTLARSLERRFGEESPLGNFVASQMLALTPAAELAIMNGGGIRADFPQGALTYGALYATLPFDNRFALVKLLGKDVRVMFERNLHADNGILSVAGARIDATCDAGKLIVSVYLEKRNKALADTDVVSIVTNDFLATGGDAAWKGGETQILEDAPPIREAIAARLRTQPMSLDPGIWFDRKAPRINKAGPRPLRCNDKASTIPASK
jgi:5'-nucleotidase